MKQEKNKREDYSLNCFYPQQKAEKIMSWKDMINLYSVFLFARAKKDQRILRRKETEKNQGNKEKEKRGTFRAYKNMVKNSYTRQISNGTSLKMMFFLIQHIDII